MVLPVKTLLKERFLLYKPSKCCHKEIKLKRILILYYFSGSRATLITVHFALTEGRSDIENQCSNLSNAMTSPMHICIKMTMSFPIIAK